MKKLLLVTAALASLTTSAWARSKVFDHFMCSGKIGTYFAGHGADRSIGSGDSMCYFVSTSDLGKRILSLCPVGTTCRMSATVENDYDAEDWSPIITRLYSVKRGEK
jgi:hypothetical protein